MKLADRFKTPLSGEQLQLTDGDMVEIYHNSSQKDRPGWVGPARVTDLTQLQHGKVTVNWQGRHITVPIEQLRRALTYMVRFMDVHDFRLHHAEQTNSWDVIARFVNTMHKRSVIVGWMHTARGGNCRPRRQTIQYYSMLSWMWH